jgi:hypothetical protein
MILRLLSKMGFHWWRFSEPSLSGRPTRRVCAWCGRDQTWDGLLARERGIIRWVDRNGSLS